MPLAHLRQRATTINRAEWSRRSPPADDLMSWADIFRSAPERGVSGVLERELIEFIQTAFKSVWSLEVLLILRAHTERTFSTEELVRELRASGPVVFQSLAALEAAGIVVIDASGRAQFSPASPDLAHLVEATHAAYRERPGEVRRAILAAPDEKLRTLADAFRFRKDRT